MGLAPSPLGLASPSLGLASPSLGLATASLASPSLAPLVSSAAGCKDRLCRGGILARAGILISCADYRCSHSATIRKLTIPRSKRSQRLTAPVVRRGRSFEGFAFITEPCSAEIDARWRRAVITNRNRKAHNHRRLPRQNRSSTYSRFHSPSPKDQPERRRLRYQLQLANPIPSHRRPSRGASLRPNPDALHHSSRAGRPRHPSRAVQ